MIFYIWSICIGIVIAEIIIILYWELPIWFYMFKHRKDKREMATFPSYSETINEIMHKNSIYKKE